MYYLYAINILLPVKFQINDSELLLIPKTKPDLEPESGIKALRALFIRSLKSHKGMNQFYVSSEN